MHLSTETNETLLTDWDDEYDLPPIPPDVRPLMEDCPQFSREEEIELLQRMRNGDEEAKNQLARSIWPWAVHCVRQLAKKTGRQRDREAINSAAGLAVATTLARFDETRGFRLVTYAYWRAKAAGYQLDGHFFGGVQSQLMNLSIVPAQRRELLRRAHRQASLDAPMNKSDETATTCGAWLIDSRAIDPHMAYDEKMRRLRLRWAIYQLPDTMRAIVQLHVFGSMPFREIGLKLKLSGQRIQQIYQQATKYLDRLLAKAPRLEAELLTPDGRQITLDPEFTVPPEQLQPLPNSKAARAAGREIPKLLAVYPPAPKRRIPAGPGRTAALYPGSTSNAYKLLATYCRHGAMDLSAVRRLLPRMTDVEIRQVLCRYRNRYFIPCDISPHASTGVYRAATIAEIEEYWQNMYPGRIPADIDSPPPTFLKNYSRHFAEQAAKRRPPG